MIRPAVTADAAACAAIYAPYVSESIVSFEAEPPTVSTMAGRIEDAHLWLVADEDEEICGYAYGSAHRERDAYQWAADVAIYLAREHQGRGLGRRLYAELFDGLRERGICVVCAGIALPNPASEGLHRALGFTEVGVYRRIAFKFGQWLDTRWYQLELRPSDRPPPPRCENQSPWTLTRSGFAT
jgi:phosphinothricin acetyltransferase